MATMVKEKRREKKKPKDKKVTKTNEDLDLNETSETVAKNVAIEENTSDIISYSATANASTSDNVTKPDSIASQEIKISDTSNTNLITDNVKISPSIENETHSKVSESPLIAKEEAPSDMFQNVNKINVDLPINIEKNKTHEETKAAAIQARYLEVNNAQNSYEALNSKLRIHSMITSQSGNIDLRFNDSQPHVNETPTDVKENIISQATEDPNTNMNTEFEVGERFNTFCVEHPDNIVENVSPSAPMLEEDTEERSHHRESAPVYVVPKMECMPLEEAIKLCGGNEIAEIKALSEREEMIVEAGPVCGPEHLLVDLLSTFRSSLMAVDRERTQLTVGFLEEEKFRSTLWKVEKRNISMRKKCPCGLNVDLKGVYEYAELLKERLPVAKVRLESLLRDVQESYCHHQHEALLAHCQIEDLIHQTINSNKSAIREALALILEALRLSDGGGAGGASVLLSAALQRWARALSTALIDGRDVRQLLHLLHHLFRQTRSVHWAANVIHLNVRDRVEAAQAIAILDLLLNKNKIEPAVECTEEDMSSKESWEEVTASGAGAVMEGRGRERDVCALLGSLPLRDLVATIALFTHTNINHTRPSDWGDRSGGCNVLWSCCAARALLNVLQRALDSHKEYRRLAARVRSLAGSLLQALAALHLHSRVSYIAEYELKLSAELEAVFAAGFKLFGTEGLESLPATLLSDNTARDYCLAIIGGLHEKTVKQLDSLSIELPVMPCAERVRIVAHAAIDRSYDQQLAAMVLDFLFQTGIKRKSVTCKGLCEKTARDLLPNLLAAHTYLYPMALHMIADLSQVETVDVSCITAVSAREWRPQAVDAVAVLSDWSQRCAHLVRHLLMALDFTPHTGISLETQLSIGAWLCEHVSHNAASTEWAWAVLRRLRTHRAWWGHAGDTGDAPPPSELPQDLFSMAFALLATSWGHSIPIICSEGVDALCKIAQARCEDAVHCLGPVMLVMASSPESVSLTPRFEEVFVTVLGHGPTLVQRALGRGPAPGPQLLLRLILAHLETRSRCVPAGAGLVSAWLHGLWRLPLLPTSAPLLDAALLATRNWAQFDAYVTSLMLDDKYKDHMTAAVRCSASAPLITECVLRSAHSQRETLVWTWSRLQDGLYAQKLASEKIHVDNVLKMMGCRMTSDDLVIFKTAAAILSAPYHHPAHLTLWRLLMYLYLQRPTTAPPNAPALGPLFFSGLVKTRTLAQLRKKLQETATYHSNERKSLLPKPKEDSNERAQNTPKSAPVDDSLLSEISIVDLMGEPNDTESSDEESSDSKASDSDSNCDSSPTETRDSASGLDTETENLIAYHTFAEKMLRDFLTWLEQGENVTAMPHHADISRYIPEPALEAAWCRELNRRRPAVGDPPAAPVSPVNAAPTQSAKTPLQMAVNAIRRIKDTSKRRFQKLNIKSLIEDVNFRDTRNLLKLVDKHLNDIESLAREWSSEVDRISCLDERLWSLVAVLRVRRPLPPVKKKCANNCKPITFVMPEDEWCISTGAENGIKENRESARVCIRRVSRPRPHAARTVAALYSIARGMQSTDVGAAACSRAWRTAAHRALAQCAPAHRALTTLCTDLAEKWLCSDGNTCASLISTWTNSSCSALQQNLCGALVSPRRLRPTHWPQVYIALLHSKLPSHAIFSYLSRFEMSRWSEHAEGSQRRDLLEALVKAAQRWGAVPHSDHHVVLELLGVHTSALLDAQEICAQARRCALASVAGTLPPQYWNSLAQAVRRCGAQVPFDQLGHTLRELGMAFWEARANAASNKRKTIDHAIYAPSVAEVLHELQRAFVAAGIALTYAPEKVGRYSWSSLQESWSPWVSPLALPPLLPSTTEGEHYTAMLQRFVACLSQVMVDCPGSEEVVLQQCFSWMTQTYTSVYSQPSQESRVQASAALAALADLPWQHHQWLSDETVHIACQISASGDSEIKSWCACRWRYQVAETWMRGVPPERYAERLAVLLGLFTAMTHAHETLEQATRLPWSQLPEMALDAALGSFFHQYHNPAQPYHELPQFRVLLFAAELCVLPGASLQDICRASSREKRMHAVSQWTRAACAPALSKHAPQFAEAILNVITDIAPYLELSPGETEDLLCRAAVVMCIEPAATQVLPVWERWVRSCPAVACAACVTAAASITAFSYYGALADCAIAAYMARDECTGWHEISARLSSGPWRDVGLLCTAARLHAAYGTATLMQHDLSHITTAFNALLSASIDFVEKEIITAVWVCFICRITCHSAKCKSPEESNVASQQHTQGDSRRLEEDIQQCAAKGRQVIAQWAAPPRRSLLNAITMQQDRNVPTPKIRALAGLAVCATAPGAAGGEAARAYHGACAQLLGPNSDEVNWGTKADPRRVALLATRLFPAAEKYFKEELEAATQLN